MSDKLRKIVTKETIFIPFQKEKFIVYSLGSLGLVFFSYFLMGIFPQIGNFPILILIAYFIPSIVGFDLFSDYEVTYKIPKLKNPNRGIVLVINLLTGWTIIGWFIALKMSLTPGLVNVEKVIFE